ncbi:MAG: acyltransferase [Bacteroidales bacterium]|nr:acyltransferase [Bacteroidales bacterium]
MTCKALSISNSNEFENACIETFRFQYKHTAIYREYVDLLGVNIKGVKHFNQIPFLPISFFKTQQVINDEKDAEIVFHSSGTTGMSASRHLVADIELYRRSFTRGFEFFYGSPGDYCFLALLPSYLERQGSSLIFMMDDLIKMSGFSQSGFYLNNLKELSSVLVANTKSSIPTILLGVSYALLDLAELHPMDLSGVIVMETGGMKGKRPEISKDKLHTILCNAFNLREVHSEYGMTELLSQAYSQAHGRFLTPPWMKIRIRDPYDPLAYFGSGKAGGINIIDLANKYSCSFIQTEDLGKLNEDGSFQVLGRLEASDIRGCNLLLQ